MSMLSNELFHTVHRGLDLGWVGTGNKGYGVIDKENLGTHWSTDVDVAKRFAHRWEDPSWRTKYSKIVHANVPMSSVETDTKTLRERGYARFGGSDPLGEKEVMVKENAPVQVTGITKLRKSGETIKSRTRKYNPPREMMA